MAVSKKYAGLPDLDPAPEIYETPELTDDVSTIQTNTLRTESPSPSENGLANDNFDRAGLNQEEARRRFEPAIVDARSTDLSGAIGSLRKGYRTTHRRRRRRRREDRVEEYGDLSGESSEEEETIGRKLARLRREAEEVRLELARMEQETEEDDFKDSHEHHQNGDPDEDREMVNGMDELNKILNDLRVSTKQSKGDTLEQEFTRHLAVGDKVHNTRQSAGSKQANETPTTSTSISAIAAFADRLTALETTLGVPFTPTTTETNSILPTLHSLSSQIATLSKTITPHSPPSDPSTQPYIDTLSSRLKTLHLETETLLTTRKVALQTLTSLHDTRNRASTSSSVYAKYISKREARERQRDSLNTTLTTTTTTTTDNEEEPRPQSKDQPQPENTSLEEEKQKIYTTIFLDEQATKITALYNTLSTIQDLQPLLPLVLERLRGLNVVHAGAATAQQDMMQLETRMEMWEEEMQKWRNAVEGVERGIEESKEVLRENLEVVGGMVRGVEGRLDELERRDA